jgi:DNA-binding CsgD family transcriptional regulator
VINEALDRRRGDAGALPADRDIGSALAILLDTLDLGVLLLAHDGNLLIANESGRRLLRLGQPLELVDGAVKPSDPAHDAAWDRALRDSESGIVQTIDMTSGRDTNLLSIRAIYAPGNGRFAQGDRPVGETGRDSHTYGVYFGSRHDSIPERVRIICSMYGLTPSEGRVLQSVANDESPKNVARALGLAESTVRCHLGQIRAKLGVRTIRSVAARVACVPPCRTEGGTRSAQQAGTAGVAVGRGG